jgi:hypothetical protein
VNLGRVKPQESWHVYWGDIHAGTIQIRSDIPFREDPWGRSCGFKFNGPALMAHIGFMRALNRHAMSRVADSFA